MEILSQKWLLLLESGKILAKLKKLSIKQIQMIKRSSKKTENSTKRNLLIQLNHSVQIYMVIFWRLKEPIPKDWAQYHQLSKMQKLFNHFQLHRKLNCKMIWITTKNHSRRILKNWKDTKYQQTKQMISKSTLNSNTIKRKKDKGDSGLQNSKD